MSSKTKRPELNDFKWAIDRLSEGKKVRHSSWPKGKVILPMYDVIPDPNYIEGVYEGEDMNGPIRTAVLGTLIEVKEGVFDFDHKKFSSIRLGVHEIFDYEWEVFEGEVIDSNESEFYND